MFLISHRGVSTQHAENTAAAFSSALSLGFHGCETDVRIDSDGCAILFHDRIARNGVAVKQLTRAQLSDIQGYRVPTLADMLQAHPHAYWNIELKSRDCWPATREILRSLPRLDRCLISSFHHPLAVAAAQETHYDCALLLAHTPLSLSFIERTHLSTPQLNHLVLDYEVCDEESLIRCHELGFRTWIYGAHNQAEHDQINQWPVHGVISDHPQYLGLGPSDNTDQLQA